MREQVTQLEFVAEWFRDRPDQDIAHAVSKPAIEREWYERFGVRMEDPDRAIRKLAEEGVLEKVKNGVYRYLGSSSNTESSLNEIQRNLTFERDGFACVICSRGPNNHLGLQAVMITPTWAGGSTQVANAVTKCDFHSLADVLAWEHSSSRSLAKSLLESAPRDSDQHSAEALKFWGDFVLLLAKYGLVAATPPAHEDESQLG